MSEQKWDWAELKKRKQAENSEADKVISLVINPKPSDKNKRAVLAKAIMDDEAIRRASVENSRAYLNRIEEETSGTPFWMWCTLYFILGMLFMITVDTVSFGWEGLSLYLQEVLGKYVGV